MKIQLGPTMKLIPMTPQEWWNVPDNPIQRNTAEHAKKAIRGHLAAPHPSHAIVHAAQLTDGTLVKLDGHTRSALWMDGRLQAPATVQVIVHKAASLEDAIGLYKHFDNPSATENAGDRLAGAYRLSSIVPKSRLLTHGGVTAALNLMNETSGIYSLVSEWKIEIELLDEMDLSVAAMPSVLIAAALLTIRKHGRKALDFWRLYAAGGGTRINGKSCGCDELTRIVADLRARKQLGNGGANSRRNQAGRAISCCEAWLLGRSFSVGAKTSDFTAYLGALRSKPTMQQRTAIKLLTARA